jgi:hypothetical protein
LLCTNINHKGNKTMAKVLDYLNHLDQNADALAAHKQNPQQAMTNFGLSTQDQQAINSGDKEQIAQAAGIRSEELPGVEIPQL